MTEEAHPAESAGMRGWSPPVSADTDTVREWLPNLDEIGPVLLQVLDEDEAMSAFQVLGSAGYRILSVAALARLEAAEQQRDALARAATTLARYLVEHVSCESWFPNPSDPVDACGECVPCHAVGLVEGDGDSLLALASVPTEGRAR